MTHPTQIPPSTREAHVPQGYKMTKLGVIPEDWEVLKFSETFDLIKSYSHSRADLAYEKLEPSIYNIHYGDIHSKFDFEVLDVKQNLFKQPFGLCGGWDSKIL